MAKARLLNRQSKQRSIKVAKVHYDIGNAFYEAMLDPYMQYTCACWNGTAKDLASAREAKLDLICRKLHQTWKELRGESVYPVTSEEKSSYASISKTKTFASPPGGLPSS